MCWKEPRKLAAQVELVLVVDSAAAESKTAVRKALTAVARRTTYLRLIGLSILWKDFTADDLPRAFPWLLSATKRWFEGKEFKHSGDCWRSATGEVILELKDYRTEGIRRLALHGECGLQLVHGHNGSGKSSIAEALELLLTDRVQRLDDGGQQQYFFSVKYRSQGVNDADLPGRGCASASLKQAGRNITLVEVEPDKMRREGKIPDSALRTNSFKIDQVFMDKLVRSEAADRLALFLNAFSPAERDLVPTMNRLSLNLRNGLSALPEHIRPAISEDRPQQVKWILEQFGSLRSSEAANPLKEALLPIPSSIMRLLSVLHPSFETAFSALTRAGELQALKNALAAFDESLGPLASAVRDALVPLRTSLRVLEEFQSWRAGKRGARGASLQADLDRWLELQAMLDLVRKRLEVEKTVRAAIENQWVVPSRDADLLRVDASNTFPGRLSARVDELGLETREAHDRVLAWSQPGTSEAGPSPSPVRSRLFDSEVSALDQAGKWLQWRQTSKSTIPLGEVFQRALVEGQEQSWGSSTTVIGRPGGLDQLIQEAQDLIAACDTFEKATVTQASDTFQNISQMLDHAEQLQKITADLPNTFFQRLLQDDGQILKDLVAAFNELLALMTSARWQYRDIDLIPMNRPKETPDDGSAPGSIEYKTREGARADLLFNTAELNSSALALFLLLAPRLPNPLRLLILDDPLQNMDELTVITVARAIGKLLRKDGVYPAGWSVLAFFHGEENVERLREETHSVVYQLPWLHSSGGGADDTIRAVDELSMWPSEVQILDKDLLEIV